MHHKEGNSIYRGQPGWYSARPHEWPERLGDVVPHGPTLCPGFIDLHIHGVHGQDFMTARASDFTAMMDYLAESGYEGLLPTTITAPAEAVDSARQRWPGHRMMLGFHLEGPFLSEKYPGAQPKEALASPTDLAAWEETLQDPRLRLVTLAPEIPGGMDLLRRLVARDVIVSLGHTNATFAEATAAVDAGARHATHTFNAMRPLHHREAGTVGAVLADDRIRGELIYDRLHVSPAAAAVLLRAKGPEGVIAVSDSTRATGLPEGTVLDMWGHPGTVQAGSVRLADGTLAGSCFTLRDAFDRLREDFGFAVAVSLTSWSPRRQLGLTAPPSVWHVWE